MQRKLLGCCAFLLFATFGMLSGVAQAHHDEPNAPSETLTLQGEGLQRQEMSDEEKERRREECATAYLACVDWCKKTNPKNPSARGKCDEECSKKNTECMKKIESNPIEDPDY
jgi:hypothetical protein